MTIVFIPYIIVHFIGLRLWRKRYRSMQKDSYDRFHELDFSLEEDS